MALPSANWQCYGSRRGTAHLFRQIISAGTGGGCCGGMEDALVFAVFLLPLPLPLPLEGSWVAGTAGDCTSLALSSAGAAFFFLAILTIGRYLRRTAVTWGCATVGAQVVCDENAREGGATARWSRRCGREGGGNRGSRIETIKYQTGDLSPVGLFGVNGGRH